LYIAEKPMATPKSPVIALNDPRREILIEISRKKTATHCSVWRSHIILEAAGGLANTRISAILGVSSKCVRCWRNRWLSYEASFASIELQGGPNMEWYLAKKIRECLSDGPRPGHKCKFTAEQYCGIIAIALEPPENSGLPITEWTRREIATEAVKRGIVDSISPSQVGLFLKGLRRQAPQDRRMDDT